MSPVAVSTPVPAIRAELKLHPDVQTLDDEWSGITDPVIRRKLQNRLNQRAARRRKAERLARANADDSSPDGSIKTSKPKTIIIRERIDPKDLSKLKSQSNRNGEWAVAAERFRKSQKSAFVSIRNKNACRRWYELLIEGRMVEGKEIGPKKEIERDTSWMYPLPADHLISLVYYNVYRALVANVHLLGLDINLMYTDDYPSPFTPMSQTATSAIRRLPPALQPTELQKTIAHHPQWDVLPDPVLRDNLLQCDENNFNEVEFCYDLVGGIATDCLSGLVDYEPPNDSLSGLIVWGDPWDIYGWEVTEVFAQKWWFILLGAMDLQASTNRWRIARGEEPLNFHKMLDTQL